MDSVFQKPLDDDIQDVAEGMAIVINGDTAPQAISSGQYLFIKNHSTLATGGYHATAAITSGGSVTSSNVAADANGIVNAAYSALNGKITPTTVTGWSKVTEGWTSNNTKAYRMGKLIVVEVYIFGTPESNKSIATGLPIPYEIFSTLVSGFGVITLNSSGNLYVSSPATTASAYGGLSLSYFEA